MTTKKNNDLEEAGPISVRILRKEESELFQTDMGWKYSIPFHGTPLELACYLYKLANWLEHYGQEKKQNEKEGE